MLVPTILLLLNILSNASGIPVIGILSQETYSIKNLFPEKNYSSYIAASYVKFIEMSAAQVIPIWIGQDEAYYEKVVQYTNGLLFPGGATYFNETGGYGEAAKQLYNFAIKANEQGIYYPIYGICLGMQALAFSAANGEDIRTDCSAHDIALPLKLLKGYENSRIFSDASSEIINILQTENVTYNSHIFCILEENLIKNNLTDNWTVVSVSNDKKNIEFVSTMENKHYPFYGVQFHPEKNLFEFNKKLDIPHSRDAVYMAQYFSNFFVAECFKNSNSFPNEQNKSQLLIYNFNPVYTGERSSFEQLYLFQAEDFESYQLP